MLRLIIRLASNKEGRKILQGLRVAQAAVTERWQQKVEKMQKIKIT